MELENNYLCIQLLDDIEYNFNNLDEKIEKIKIVGNPDKKRTINIDNLSRNIKYLDIENCNIESIYFLPIGIETLKLQNTNIFKYHNLPVNLKNLYISFCTIEDIDNLPQNLEYLNISYCTITNIKISNLPKKLKHYIFFNSICGFLTKEDITPPNDYCIIEIKS